MTQRFANNAVSTLNGAISSSATTINLQTGDGAKFPALSGGDYFLATLIGKTAGMETSWEIVKCTSRSSDTLTVERAREGTASAAWADATPIELRLTAGSLTPPNPDVESLAILNYIGY
ncbi:MAG: hypothetical protein WC091_04545 [Sulfuricellaceae bacterium]